MNPDVGRSLKEMIRNKTERVILIVSLLITAIPFLAFCKARNDFWECCTTKAYGFPMPWYIDHCLCGKDQPAINPLFCFVNIGLWAGASILLAWIAGNLKKTKANNQQEGIVA